MSGLQNISNKELLEGLKDPAKAEAIVNTIKTSLDEVVNAFEQMKIEVAAAHTDLATTTKLAEDNAKAAADLTQAIKNIHIALNVHRDVLPEDLQNLANELGKFVMSGAAIKIGVLANANATK